MKLFSAIAHKIRLYTKKRNTRSLILDKNISIDTMLLISNLISSVGYRETHRMKHNTYFINKSSHTHISFTSTYYTDDYSVEMDISFNRNSRTIKVDVETVLYANTAGYDGRNVHLEFDTDISINSLISKSSSTEKVDFVKNIVDVIPSVLCNTIENLRW